MQRHSAQLATNYSLASSPFFRPNCHCYLHKYESLNYASYYKQRSLLATFCINFPYG